MDYKMIKSAGEHWVCATLARHGWAPALTRDGLERTDILAVSTKLAERPVIEMQVKTASQRSALLTVIFHGSMLDRREDGSRLRGARLR
jgi:hypothetical protein